VREATAARSLDAEAEAMAEFATGRLRWFQGRHAELAELGRFVVEAGPNSSRVCVVRAVPGQGKSALLARFAEGLEPSSGTTRPAPILISHFVGATERSADPGQLAERLVRELDRRDIPILEGETDRIDFGRRLAAQLEHYDGEQLIILLIDGVNQLTLTSRDDELAGQRPALSWLPRALGPKVRVILSCVTGDDLPPDSPEARVLSALSDRRPEPTWIDLQPLDESDVREIVVGYLAEYCKELDDEPLDTICRLDQARNPLYLLVMLSELRTLGGNDLNHKVPQLIAELEHERPSAVHLFNWVLERLETFGPTAVALWCGYLALGRAGLSGEELAGLLSKQLGARGTQVARRIERGLRRYLQRRGAQLDYFHGQLRTAVQRRYIGSDRILPQDELTLRAHLEAFFGDRADPGHNGSFEGENPRDLTEMIHQQTAGRFWTGMEGTGRAFSALLDQNARQALPLCRRLVAIIEESAERGAAADGGKADDLVEDGRMLLHAVEVVAKLSGVLRGAYESDRASLRAGARIRWAMRKLSEWLGIVQPMLHVIGEIGRHPQIQSQIEDLLDQLDATTSRLARSWRALFFQTSEWRYDELYAVIGCSLMKRWEMERTERSEVLPGQEECELIAKVEHERWHREMRAHGWTPGPMNPAERRDPRLVPWADLDAIARDDLVRLVQELPAVLAEGEFVITRGEKRRPRFE